MITITDPTALELPLLGQDDIYNDLNIAETTFSETLPIRDIQGTGLVSDMTGTPVRDVAGIVTAITSDGFQLQDPDPDDNPRTWEDIFVFTNKRDLGVNGLNLSVGASVQVSVRERQLDFTNEEGGSEPAPELLLLEQDDTEEYDDPYDTYNDQNIAQTTFYNQDTGKITSETLRIRDIQGYGLVSEKERNLVSGVAGIVTGFATNGNGFYLQDPDPDNDLRTSEGIFVFTGSRDLGVNGLNITVGASVRVSGQVQENRPNVTINGERVPDLTVLSTTQIAANRETNTIEVVSSGNPLPAPILIGSGGRVPPNQIIAGTNFSPDTFDISLDLNTGIGFYESLEGMRVTVQDTMAVSPTIIRPTSSDSIWTVANRGADATGINSRGGIGIAPDDFNPERIQISATDLPRVDVGDLLGNLTGVVDYAFGDYRVLVTEPVTATSGGLQREVTNLIGTADKLTIASYNVENLNPTVSNPGGLERFGVLANQILNNLRSPDIIGLQEIQDNNGPIDDGTVAADLTYQALINAIKAAGGPTYQFLNINPVNNRDGGAPGTNIRVGYLYNPSRVSFVEGSLRRITDPIATPDNDGAFTNSRKPLVATFTFNGQEVTVINNHLTSRRGGNSLFGNVQPPNIGSAEVRANQATVINSEVNAILADDPNANVVVLGDLNGFDFEEFQQILSGGVLTNLSQTLDVRDRATFNFQGNSQALDHVLVTNNLADDAQYDIVHVNVDFVDQPADHEPVVASVDIPLTPPKNIVLSLDGLTFRFVKEYLENGQLDANTGLGYLINKGIFLPATVTTPSNTAPVHIAIATGSTAANNNINNNSFRLIRSPFVFGTNIRGFGAPIGGYDPFHPDGAHEHEATELTAEPVWVKLREAGKKVVSATFPGADGATVFLPGVNPPVVLQSNGIRTVDFTVPFGTGANLPARGFGLSGANFTEAPAGVASNLVSLGIPFFGTVKVASLETISGIAGAAGDDFDQEEDFGREIPAPSTTISGGSDRSYDLKAAAIDSTDDNVVNYDRVIVFDANAGITINNAPPSTGSAFLGLGREIAPFFFEGSNNVVGVSYLLTQLTPDLSTVHLIRTSANHIPRPANNPAAIASIDNTNNTVGFWRPQPDLTIARGTANGLGNFSEIELEGAYATLNEAFSQYQTDIFLNAVTQTPNTDLAFGYLEGPDGVSHNFLLTDPRQATDRSNPNSILGGQDLEKVARYQDLVADAYKVASDRVQQVIDYVGVDANGVPNSNIIITSDHGFAPFHTSVSLPNILSNGGPGVLNNLNLVRPVTGSSTVNIYINLQGREPGNNGVSVSRYRELQQQIVDVLRGVVDTNPNYVNGPVPVFDNIFTREIPDNATVEDVINASGEFIGQDTGDVFAQLSLGYTFNGFQRDIRRKDDLPPASGQEPLFSVPTFYGDHGYDSNLPEMKASFIAAGPDFNPTTLAGLTEIRSIDIAPTILDILDVEPASTVDGESILTQPFTLQILQTSDQEAGIPAFQDILGFSAVMNALDNRYANTLKLTTGDVYISSPFFNASRDIYDNGTTANPQADQGGIADILINNELGWDVASVGNHEFSGGAGSFLNLVAPNPNWVNGQNGGVGIGPGGYPGTAFPYLANNLDYSRATLPNGLSVVANGGAPLPNTLTGSVVKDFNGEKVGIIGIVTPYLKSIADTGAIQVTTRDANGNVITGTTSVDVQVDSIIRNITPEVQALSNAGINKIILMTHLQESRIEIALAQKMAALGLGVDLLLGGGSHQLMSSETGVPPLREDETQQNNGQLLQPFPQVYGEGDNRVVFVNSAANYRYLNQLVVTFDYKGVVSTIGDDSGPYATDIAGVDRLYDESITTLDQVKAKADQDIVNIVDGVQSFVNQQDGNIFGQTDVFLNGVRGDVRTQETNLGNLTADAQDFYAEAYLNEHNLLPGFNKLDISFTNGGSIRDHIGQFQVEQLATFNLTTLPPQANPEVGKEEGDVSQLDIANSLRFDGDLVVGTVTATGFLQLAEHMISSVETGNGRFGQIGGFNFSYDPTAPTGQRIRSLALADATGKSVQTIAENGKLVVASNTVFSVVTQGFLANGGDSYPTVIENIKRLVDFDEPDSLGKANLRPGRIQDAFAEYLSAFYNNNNGQQPFNQADTPQSEDKRIQSLGFRQDTVLDGITPLLTNINGTTGDDVFDAAVRDGKQFIGNNQLLNTGSGNDTVNVRFAVGGNNIRTASGNDTVYAGTNNRIDTGVGNDLLFLGSAGGNNIVTGGTGKDNFWITENDALLPANPNIIADYRANQGDLIGFFSTSLSFGSRGTNWDYRQAGANTIIEAFGQDVAILNGINASTLTQANFIFS
ncbi:MAG: hypothetical protein GPJ15_03965 [Microcystis aeruginosa G11-06]|nr:hypothetical protein [Microcystis aeruginosa G11-06]NCS34700.1 hypothetical protein [Microcystis aeruginosa G11-01]